MFVIGRNVEAKIENGKLTIVCQIENMVPIPSEIVGASVVATTDGLVDVPKTNLRLSINLYRMYGKYA